MRILYVVQRYGENIAGGAEQHCREFAERMVERDHRVDVLTTCAASYVDWANEFPPGNSVINGVGVRRMPVAQPRDGEMFSRLNSRLANSTRARPLDLQREWMRAQGPETPALPVWLRRFGRSYDAVVFVTYLYWTTWAGLPEVSGAVPTLLHATAHDEPPLRLSLFDELFLLPDAFAFLTPEEGALIHRRFRHSPRGEVVGIGVELPRAVSPAAFRRQFGLGERPYLLYVGRVDPAKGAAELLDYFVTYKDRSPSDLALVFVGEPVMDFPDRSDIVVTGFVTTEVRDAAFAGALALVQPSYFESFSMVLTEAFAHGRPAIVQGRCEVLAGHAHRSGAAIPYMGFAEWEVAADMLVSDPVRADELGVRGRHYVEREYSWDVVLDRYERLLTGVVSEFSAAEPASSA